MGSYFRFTDFATFLFDLVAVDIFATRTSFFFALWASAVLRARFRFSALLTVIELVPVNFRSLAVRPLKSELTFKIILHRACHFTCPNRFFGKFSFGSIFKRFFPKGTPNAFVVKPDRLRHPLLDRQQFGQTVLRREQKLSGKGDA